MQLAQPRLGFQSPPRAVAAAPSPAPLRSPHVLRGAPWGRSPLGLLASAPRFPDVAQGPVEKSLAVAIRWPSLPTGRIQFLPPSRCQEPARPSPPWYWAPASPWAVGAGASVGGGRGPGQGKHTCGGSGWAVPVMLLRGQGRRRGLECSPGQREPAGGLRPGGGLGQDCAHLTWKHEGGWQPPDLRPVHHRTCYWPSSQSLKPKLRTLDCGQSGVISRHRVTLNLPENQPWTSISHPGAPIHQAATSQSLPRAGKMVLHRGTGSPAAWGRYTGQHQETLPVWGLS